MFSFLLNYHICTSLSHVFMSMFIHIELFAHVKQLIFHPIMIIIVFMLVYMKTQKYIWTSNSNSFSHFTFHFNWSLFDHYEKFTFHHPNATSISWIIHIWKWNMTTIFSCFNTKIFSRSNIFLTLQGSIQEITFLCPQPQLTLPQGPNLMGYALRGLGHNKFI